MAPSITEAEPVLQVPLKKPEIETKAETETPLKDINHEEHQYLDLIREILETGEHRPDRFAFL